MFISRKKLFLFLFYLSFSYLLLIVVCSVIAVTWTSAAGHPLHQAVSFHALSFYFTSFPMFSRLSVFMIMFFRFSFLCHSLFHFLILVSFLFLKPFCLHSLFQNSSCSSSSCLISTCFSLFLWFFFQLLPSRLFFLKKKLLQKLLTPFVYFSFFLQKTNILLFLFFFSFVCSLVCCLHAFCKFRFFKKNLPSFSLCVFCFFFSIPCFDLLVFSKDINHLFLKSFFSFFYTSFFLFFLVHVSPLQKTFFSFQSRFILKMCSLCKQKATFFSSSLIYLPL